MLRNRIINGTILVFMFLYYIFTDSYLGLMLIVVSLILFLISFLSLLFARNKITLTFETFHSFYKNQNESLFVHISNNSLLPIATIKIKMEVTNRLIDEQIKEDVYISLNGKSNLTVPITLNSRYVGQVEVKVTSIILYDYFGNFSLLQWVNNQSILYILPLSYPIKIQQMNYASSASDFVSEMSIKKAENTSDIIGHKEYQIGDNVKQINWKLSSKTDDMMVKEMSQPQESSVFILLEPVSENMNPEQINLMIELFFSLSKSVLDSGESHLIGWFVEAVGQLKVINISSAEQLNNSLREMLEIQFRRKQSMSLNSFLQSEYSSKISQLYYIMPAQVTIDYFDELDINNMIRVQCSTDDIEQIDASDSTVLITPQNINEIGQNIVI